MGIDLTYLLIVLAVILFSMTLHEAMHGFMAYYLGDDTAKLLGRLSLNPIVHIDPFMTIILPLLLAISGGPIFGGAKPVPFNPNRLRYDEWGVALVAIAGPLTNLVIAFVAFGLSTLIGADGGMLASLLGVIVMVNLGFFVFNLIPLPPLDGSRVLYALAPDFVRRGMEQIERYGLIVVFAIVMLSGPLLGSFMSSAIQGVLGVFSTIFRVA